MNFLRLAQEGRRRIRLFLVSGGFLNAFGGGFWWIVVLTDSFSNVLNSLEY